MPGVRKSGIPAETEMPAPAITRMRFALPLLMNSAMPSRFNESSTLGSFSSSSSCFASLFASIFVSVLPVVVVGAASFASVLASVLVSVFAGVVGVADADCDDVVSAGGAAVAGDVDATGAVVVDVWPLKR